MAEKREEKEMTTEHRFEALSKICLNNWHYIQRKVISFSEGINFFTGHSGSGKSTVIDAMQIVLYADTDGRGFFNKAAADESDRSLLEYLKGMVNIEEDNASYYLRNQNFSSTIALEFRDTQKEVCQCVGVVFDVTVKTNEITRLFFWHKGSLPEDHYRTPERPKSTDEIKKWLAASFSEDSYYYGAHNERFRKQLYDIYLGGLDGEKFPKLFKKAIPFRMRTKLEDFIKEYIFTEQDIHIEDMQNSVMEYGRMRKRIEETCQEIEKLEAICTQYEAVQEEQKNEHRMAYYLNRLAILQKEELLQNCQKKIKNFSGQLEEKEVEIVRKQEEIQQIREQRDECIRQLAGSDYERTIERLQNCQQWLENWYKSKAEWEKCAKRLTEWESVESVSSQTLWDIESFQKGTIELSALQRLQKSLQEVRKEIDEEYGELCGRLREQNKRKKEWEQELSRLKQGEKAYPRELEELRHEIQRRLSEENHKNVSVDILADLLEIRNEEWKNAIEGYLGNQKLGIIVEPWAAKRAMEIYQTLDRAKYHRYGVVDTKRVLEEKPMVQENSLAEEVEAPNAHVGAYLDLLLGKVIKCRDVEELRNNRIGITNQCVLYKNYRIQHINPENYTRFSYIGKNSVASRIRLLQKDLRSLEEQKQPVMEAIEQHRRILSYEALTQETEKYMEYFEVLSEIKKKEKEKAKLEKTLNSDMYQNARHLENRKADLEDQIRAEENALRVMEKRKGDVLREFAMEKNRAIDLNEDFLALQNAFALEEDQEEAFVLFSREKQSLTYEKMQEECLREKSGIEERHERYKNALVELRSEYLKQYPNRNFELTRESNEQYQALYDKLKCENLEEYKQRANEQAKTAVLHFKDDFMYKIRSAIKDAMQRKDELNRIIRQLDFGKDKYQFSLGKNKGADGEYYDMFMDDSLEIDPSDLDIGLDHQLNLFTMEHENTYGAMINDLINIFIPPINATAEEMEEAKKNMDKYADYRTYLSFNMEQIIQNENGNIKISLNKMLTKNSGGEGQNPLYVALLASFAQIYKIDLRTGLHRNPTLRLVVLDEAFSKMDAEKVASCISLMRGLGFQAIISATNDKIQNYLETVDKVFVFANPNKRAISIQEFERKEFEGLRVDIVEEASS